MKTFCTCLLASAILATFGPLAAQSSDTSGTQPVISLAIRAIHNSVQTGSPVRIKATLTNTSSHEISITRDIRGRDCTVDVRDANGKLAPDTKMGYVWNGHVANPDPSRVSPEDLKGALESGTVKPGETLTWELDAAKFYEMSQPGKYTIQIRRGDPETPSISVKSNTLTVTVTQ